jgi:hypothetical protein
MYARTRRGQEPVGGERRLLEPVGSGVSGDGSPTTWNGCWFGLLQQIALRYIDELRRGNLVNVGGKRNRFVSQRIHFIEKVKTLFPAARMYMHTHACTYACTRRGQELVGGEGRLLASVGSDVREKAFHRWFVSHLAGERIYNLQGRGLLQIYFIEKVKTSTVGVACLSRGTEQKDVDGDGERRKVKDERWKTKGKRWKVKDKRRTDGRTQSLIRGLRCYFIWKEERAVLGDGELVRWPWIFFIVSGNRKWMFAWRSP